MGWRLEGPKARGVAPRRTKVAWGGVQKDQGRVGRRREGPRVREVAPRRIKIVWGGALKD